MKFDWLELLINPAPWIRDRGAVGVSSAVPGIALLLEARVVLYNSRATERDWPRLGMRYHPRGEADEDLLGALVSQFSGDPNAIGIYREIAADTSNVFDLRSVAAILAGIALSDQEDPQRGIEGLDNLLEMPFGHDAKLMLLLHSAVRAADAGAYDQALARTQRALDELKAVPGAARRKRLFRAIALHNRWQFEQQLGQLRTTALRLPVRASLPELTRIDLLAEEAFGDLFERQFDTSLESPYVRTVVFAAVDDVEVGLFGALLRAECLADWSGIRRMRRLSGRYQVTAKAGVAERSFEAAFALLRRAGDSKGVQHAARLVTRIGPLESLREATRLAIALPWLRGDLASYLALLEYGADLLSQREADSAISRIFDSECLFVNAPQATRALGAVTELSSRETQDQVASRVLELASGSQDDLLLQELSRVLLAVRWLEVSDDTKVAWLEFIRKYLASPTSHQFTAQAAASTLGRSMSSVITQAVIEALGPEPRLDLVTVLINIDAEVSDDVWARALARARSDLARRRRQASEGTYGFGWLNVASLTIDLLSRLDDEVTWNELSAFLLDQRVLMEDKTQALNRLTEPDVRLPANVAAMLGSALPRLEEGPPIPLGGSPELFEAARLRLASHLNAIDGGTLLSGLLRLAASPASIGRIAAADLVPGTRGHLDDSTALSVAVLLTRDVDPDVRAHAARALGMIVRTDSRSDPGLARLGELLDEPSAIVPAASIAGLVQRHRAGLPMPDDVVREVERLEKRHPSHRVRKAATTLLNEFGRSATSS